MAPQVRTAQFWELVWLSRASCSTDSEVGVCTMRVAFSSHVFAPAASQVHQFPCWTLRGGCSNDVPLILQLPPPRLWSCALSRLGGLAENRSYRASKVPSSKYSPRCGKSLPEPRPRLRRAPGAPPSR